MDISGMIQSYDSRAISSAALTRAIMAPQYSHNQPYIGATSSTLVAPQQQNQHNQIRFSAYSVATPNGLVPAFSNNYIQQRPLSRLMQRGVDGSRGSPYTRNNRRGSVVKHQRRSPPIKIEQQRNVPTSSLTSSSPKSKNITSPLPNSTTDIHFGTEVDTLMKAIQAKFQSVPPQTSSPVAQSVPVVGVPFAPPCVQSTSQGSPRTGKESKFKLTGENVQDKASSPKGSKKRYQCTIKGCSQSFKQKSHLDIHVRKHTGERPHHCKEPGCGRSFSQMGNLKTHTRLHTGDKPFPCEVCGKRFAQRGNVRAHKMVHYPSKPYQCRLDDCGKEFTQLGNLKSHQNKFHITTIRKLTSKFASIKDGDIVNAADKELWEYFADLYKNSNKGIKGRGKNRRVGPRHLTALSSSMRSLGVSGSGYSLNGAGRGNMVFGAMGAGMRGNDAGRGEAQYVVFDADDESQGGKDGGGGSPVGSCYDDAPSDGLEDDGRAGTLTFGDRIY